ncbi:topoisomerase-like protein, partial [Fructobacillus tropaeoli]
TSTQQKETQPPKLLDLASLSAILAKEGFQAKEVASTYQKLYEAKIVSYPRTEDKTITPEQYEDLRP